MKVHPVSVAPSRGCDRVERAIGDLEEDDAFRRSFARVIKSLCIDGKLYGGAGTFAGEVGYTVVPTTLYLKDGRAKVEIALARGKRQYDKRQTIAKRDSERQVERAIKDHRR